MTMTCPQCNGDRTRINPADPSVGCPEEVIACDLCDDTGEIDKAIPMDYIYPLADLKCQLAAMTKERDDWKLLYAESQRTLRNYKDVNRDLITRIRELEEAAR
jgi:hypothetical protein